MLKQSVGVLNRPAVRSEGFSGNCMTGIHDSLTVIDGLIISKWSRAVFVDMRKGGRIDRSELYLLDLGGVRRHNAQHSAMETLVRRQRRPDHPGAYYSRYQPRQSGRENRHHP